MFLDDPSPSSPCYSPPPNYETEQNRTTGMETWYRLKVTGGEGEGIMVERGEGTRQRTCMNDPWTWTTVWGLTVGVGGGMGRGEQRGKIETIVIE